jgi:hypothetical protein
MSAGHDDDLLPDAVRKLEDDIFVIKEYIANEIVATDKRTVSVFSDAQTARIEQIIATAIALLLGSDAFASRVAKEVGFLAGGQALRFILWIFGSFILGAISVVLAYLKFKS